MLEVPLLRLCAALLGAACRKGVAASVALGMGMGPESGVSFIVGSLTGGVEVAASGSSCGVGPASS